MDEMITIAPQIVFADSDGYIMGITSPDIGVEVVTEYNCSACWSDDAPLYILDSDTVREATDEERQAWREAHQPQEQENPVEDLARQVSEMASRIEVVEDTSTDDLLLELMADHEERLCMMEIMA